jgi:hypothetical protein
MNADDVQDLIPMVEILLKPMEKSEARELLQYLIASMGSGSPRLEAEDVRRAVSRERNIIASRINGPRGGRPNIVGEYVKKYREASSNGNGELADEIKDEVRHKLSRSSYYKFMRSAGLTDDEPLQRGRPTKVDAYVQEYRKMKEQGLRKESRNLLEEAKDDLSPSSYYKLLRELHLKKKAGVGRPSKVDLFENAYRDHMNDGNVDFAESVLDYARSKLSRSSYFKLKKRLKQTYEIPLVTHLG